MRHRPHAHSAGLKTQPPHYSYESRWYYQFQLIVVTQGILYFEDASEKAALGPGHAAVLRVGSAFRLSTEKEGYAGICFIDTNPRLPIFTGTAETLLLPPRLRAISGMIESEGQAPQPGTRDILLGLGLSLAWQAVRLIGKDVSVDSANYGTHCAERAREALDLALRGNRGARDILSGMGMSYRQVSRYFQDTYGMSPKQHQLNAKIEEASQLLKSTDMPVTAIAYELGFSSSQHFATRFTKATGQSPSAFRAQG